MVWSTLFDVDHEKDEVNTAPPRQLLAANANNYLDHCGFLSINSAAPFTRLSGIVCSIGPACMDTPTLERMMEAGMNIARITCAFGAHEETLSNLKDAVNNYSKRLGMIFPLGVGLDIKGPEIRTGFIEGGPNAEMRLKTGEQIKLTTDKAYLEKGTASVLYVDYDNIQKVVQVGNHIYLDYGLIGLVCTNIQGSVLTCTIENGGVIGGCRKVNLPGVAIDLPVVSQQDKEHIRFGVKNDVDIVFVSSIREAAAIGEVRNILGPQGRNIKIIAKIENQQGMQNLDEIIKAADGILVARGDLGIELPIEKLFLAQKSIMAKCMKAGKPVMCSSQLLESMTKKPRPTCAECTDVANVILDGSDCLVLNKETQQGEYPVECVLTCSNICKEVEAALWQKKIFVELASMDVPPLEVYHAISISAVEAAAKCCAAAIIVLTTSGKTAFLMAKYRPTCPIITVTRNERTARIAHLYRGVLPLIYTIETVDDWNKDLEVRISFGVSFGKWRGFIKSGDPIVAVHGSRKGSGTTDTLRILYVTKALAEGEPCGCD